ncbi:hypothetical protein BBJ29_003805 [Phytophthora kernoviae]|uniref:Uncharacterized protein n=1 Tax=Phytophthora kernoviae TaxID=325452 RepID=A0A3F2RG93_9STRA|nr:hypothetical protein BBP00_00008126 [Phytophthora kernoviae]RLN66883.1 hypothetical protein BBJ29_003805 [Phytophthora kernoviae]
MAKEDRLTPRRPEEYGAALPKQWSRSNFPDWGRRINHQHLVRYDHRTSFIQCDGFQVRVVDNNFCTRFIGHYTCTIFHNVGSCFDYIFTNTYTNVKYSDAYKRAFSHTYSDSFNGNYCANNLFEQQQCQRI